jgi:hypothetical protein
MRNTKIVHITADNRDKGKAYFLKEMPALRAENWGLRVLFALENAGFQVPEEVRGTGMAALASFGVQKVLSPQLNFQEFEPLLDEMMGCVERIPNPENESIHRALADHQDDLEEVSTILGLRAEVLMLHLGFLPAAIRSTLTSTLATAASSLTQTSPSASA